MAAPRADPSDIRARIDTSLDDAALSTFAADAHDLVETRLGDDTVGEALLGRIEAYVAAHFAAGRDPRHTGASAGSRDVDYEDRGGGGDGLAATAPGRRAIALDPTGELAPESYDGSGDEFVFNA